MAREPAAGRVVLGDDGSPSADLAWAWIMSHEWPGWRIEVVTADPDASSDGAAEPEVWHPGRPRTLPGGDATQVIHYRVAAQPVDAFRGYAHRDLLVVGPKGGGLRKALHLGSTAEALMHDPPLPLVIVRRGQATRRVLVATDGSAHCTAAVRALVGLPWIGAAEVSVVSVEEPGLDADRACSGVASLLGDAPASVRCEVLVPDELQVTYSPKDMILEAIHAGDADLLVMGTRGLSGFAALRAGSIAGALAGSAPCSVLLARAALEPDGHEPVG